MGESYDVDNKGWIATDGMADGVLDDRNNIDGDLVYDPEEGIFERGMAGSEATRKGEQPYCDSCI